MPSGLPLPRSGATLVLFTFRRADGPGWGRGHDVLQVIRAQLRTNGASQFPLIQCFRLIAATLQTGSTGSSTCPPFSGGVNVNVQARLCICQRAFLRSPLLETESAVIFLPISNSHVFITMNKKETCKTVLFTSV